MMCAYLFFAFIAVNQVNSDVTMAEIRGIDMYKTQIKNMLLDIRVPATVQRRLTEGSPLR